MRKCQKRPNHTAKEAYYTDIPEVCAGVKRDLLQGKGDLLILAYLGVHVQHPVPRGLPELAVRGHVELGTASRAADHLLPVLLRELPRRGGGVSAKETSYKAKETY